MSEANPPEEITKRLKALLRRVRRLQLMRGLLGVLTVTLGGVMVVMAVDFLLAPLPVVARWGLFVVLVVAVLAAIWVWLVKPLSRPISLVQVARWLETRHPEIQERVSSALELSGTEGGVSESLLAELVDAAKVDVADLDPGIELRGRRVKKWLWPAAGLAAVFLILFAVWPSEFGRLLARAVAPYSDLGNAGAGRFEILPGDQELLEGDALEITIRFSDEKTEQLVMLTEREDGTVTEETLSVVGVTEGKSEFVYRLSVATESFRYRMRAGRAESDPYQVRVWPKPVLESVVAAYEFPVYTDRSPTKRPLGRGVSALTGTNVVLEGRPNTPVETGKFLLDGKEAGTVKVTPGASGGRVEISWTMEPEASGLGQVMLTHRLGREVEALRFPVTVVKDEPPVVTLLTPMQRELRVRPTEQIVMSYEVEEDVGLGEVSIDLRVNGKTVEPLPEVLPDRVEASRKPLWRGEGMVYVGGLVDRWKDAREVKMRIAVSDNLPAEFQGPGIGYSEWLTVKIDRHAESLVRQELRAQQSDVRESLAKAEQDVREAKAKLESARVQEERKDEQKHTENQMKKAEEKLADAEENLEELAERMENGVQAAKVKDVLEALEKVKEAQDHAENTPLQDTGESRQAEVDMAKQAAQEAIEKLQEIREEVQQDEQRVQELAKLAELAQEEQQIAREAAERAEQNGEEAPADQQLRQEQSQVENALRQQMQQNPQAKAEALEQQAEQARELSEQARDLSEQQAALAELAEAANPEPGDQNPDGEKQDGEKQDGEQQAADAAMEEAIRGQLEKAQEKIVEDAREQAAESRQNGEQRADLLPEAVSDAEEALSALQKGEPEAAAKAAQEAAELLEELAKPGRPEGEKSEGEEGSPEPGDQNPEGESGEDAGEQSGEQSGEESGEQSGEESGEQSGEQSGEEGGEQSGEQSGEESGEQSGEESGEMSGEGDGESSELAELAERQGQVAEALEALAEGNAEEALQALQEMQAEEAAGLAEAIEDLPQVDGRSGPMGEAVGNSQNGERQAEMAAQAGEKGQAQAAAQQHGEASKSIGRAAEALERAAAEFDAKAEQAAQQEPGNQSLPLPPEALAEAFQKAAEGADAETAGEASQAAQAAAEALAQAAKQAMQNMQRGQQPGQMANQPGQPGQEPGQPGQEPGNEPEEGFRPGQGDPGVPPELAKLGVSAKDWEKLKGVMRSDVAGGGGAEIPEDYRGLVRRYFEQIAKGER